MKFFVLGKNETVESQLNVLMETQVEQVLNGFMCLICGKVLRWIHGVKRHIKDLHISHIENYLCPICKKVFRNRNLFQGHINRRHKEIVGSIDYNECKMDK